MDTKYLTTFRTIVTEGSFSKAAEKLNYTQSTITFQIGQLEKEFSVQLFEKIGRNMVLTKAGQQLVPYVDSVLEAVDKLYYSSDDVASCCGDLHIGVGETLLCYKLPQVVKAFTAQAPNARLFIRSMNCYEIRNELMAGTLDLGIFYADVGGFENHLTSYSIGHYPLTLVASEPLEKSHPDFITSGQQIDVPFLINEQKCIFRQIFERYLQKKSILLDRTIELWSIPTIINLVKSGLGVSYLPLFAVEEELRNGALTEIALDLPSSEIHAICAHHKNKWISPLMQLFINLCRTLLL